ncbi:MAG TPA: 30S ribosomal protein S1 [Candidatus Acidoferrales bacterium]|nr:30S ribosomal protein S1 [Candidatus Acidoferrales bacterium]
MSRDNDANPQVSITETATAESTAEGTASQAVPVSAEPSGASAGAGSVGAATAVARAPEHPAIAAGEPIPSASDSESGVIELSNGSMASNGHAEAAQSSATLAGGSDSTEAGATSEVPPETASESSPEALAESNSETMDQLLDQFAAPEPVVAEGEIFDGHVLAVTDAGVIVDVGGKFEGLVPAQEFADTGTPIQFGAGQTIEVERLHEHRDGYVLLSHVRAHRRRVWERIENSYRDHATIAAKVTERVKGGLFVDIGVRAFLPASQIELHPVHDLEGWKDRELDVRVLKLNRKRGNVVVSHRVILEEEQKTKRDALAASLAEGAILTGKVKNITDYGVFIDLGGIDGLLHVSDLVWGRVPHPSTVVKAGEEIQVQILKFEKEKQRISLGRKQLLPDPWATVPERFPAGTRVQGKVVGLTDYGAFVQIEPGVEGLVHVSEMSWSKRLKHPSKIMKIGDEVEVVVLEVKTDQRRISLGLRQTLPDPWEAAAEKYPVGTVVTGRVRNLADFGAFVEIEEGMEGLIHISDISWTERVKHPSEKFKKGETVEARVLKVDSQNRRLSLGVKQVNDIWANWFGAHKINDVVKGKVARITDFGAFVELAEGIEGLCHVSEIEERKPKGDREKEKGTRGQRIASILTQGSDYDFKVLRLEPETRKISLSYRAAQKQQERQEMETFRSSKSSPTATIGDAILAKRQSS